MNRGVNETGREDGKFEISKVRDDVAPTGLNYFRDWCYKDVAPTALGKSASPEKEIGVARSKTLARRRSGFVMMKAGKGFGRRVADRYGRVARATQGRSGVGS